MVPWKYLLNSIKLVLKWQISYQYQRYNTNDSIINLVFLYKKVSITWMKTQSLDTHVSYSLYEENANMHTSEAGVWEMVNRKERPCCILLKISISAHMQNQQNPTDIFSLSFVLSHPHHGFSQSSLNLLENKCHLWVTLLCSINYALYSFLHNTAKKQVFSGSHIQLW